MYIITGRQRISMVASIVSISFFESTYLMGLSVEDNSQGRFRQKLHFSTKRNLKIIYLKTNLLENDIDKKVMKSRC